MRKKGEPRDPMHIRRNTKGSNRSRNVSAREAGENSTEEPPNRRGRAIRRAAERKAHAAAKAKKAAEEAS